MSEQKDKKKFFDTGFGKFVKKAGAVVPEILDVAVDVVSGDISGAVGKVKSHLQAAAVKDSKAQELLKELQLAEYAFEKDMEELAVRDRDSARQREMAYVQAGKFDLEHFIFGMIGLLAFGFGLYVVVYVTVPEDNKPLFHTMLGLIEGVVLTMYAYHYGSSRSSRKKDDAITNQLNKK